jgi:hypothetical protein
VGFIVRTDLSINATVFPLLFARANAEPVSGGIILPAFSPCSVVFGWLLAETNFCKHYSIIRQSPVQNGQIASMLPFHSP